MNWSFFCCVILFCIHSVYTYCNPSNTTCWPTNNQINELKTNINGDLLVPTDANYSTYCQAKNPYITIRPYFVLLPYDNYDIAVSIIFIKEHDLELSIFSTGHSTSGRSEGEYNNSFQINLSNKNNIQLIELSNNEYAVKVETGGTFGPIYEFVNNLTISNSPNDSLLIAGGDCPTVGLGGYTMGGGMPVLIRYLGLGIDSVIEHEVIIANGSILIANNQFN